jgi:hypothetical protein
MLVPFVGYAEDRRFMGYVECAGERMTDLLQRSETLHVTDAYVETFADEHLVSLGEVDVERDGLYAVEASGPRGEGQRRIHTVRHRLQVQLGPYTALGHLHALPGAQPLLNLSRRGPMVPLSEATIAYVTAGELHMRDISTLVINRYLADWVRANEEQAAAFPGVPVLTEPA